MNNTLQTNSICKHYTTKSQTLTVLNDVSMTLTAGQSAAIMGPSGSGKSTLLNILGTLETPDSGQVSINDTNPFDLSANDLARFRNQNIGFIFQEHHLLPQCNVLENVLIPTLAYSDGSNEGFLLRAKKLLDRVGLSDRLDHKPAELSGGERQRVAIARALIHHPTLLLADEPTGNLDRATTDSVAELLLEVHGEEKTVLIVVTHSETFAKRFDLQYELIDGTLTSA